MNRFAWSSALIRRGRELGRIPKYGDEVWETLPESDARKVAATVVAAELWHDHVTRLPERVHDEIMVAQQMQQAEDDAAFAAVAARVRRLASVPTHAEIKKRWEQSA